MIANAVTVMKITTGEIEEPETTEDGKNRAAVERAGVEAWRELGS